MVDFALLRQDPSIIANRGKDVGQVYDASSMCLAHAGESVMVCDSYNGRIQEFYLDERPPRVAVQYTDGTKPNGITRYDNGDYIVADSAHHRVMRIGQNGATKWAVGTRGSGRDQFTCPRSVCILSDGRIVVADLINNRLQVLNADTGDALSTLARNDGEAWNAPCGITTDAQGLIYVVEWGNHRVVVITAEGKVMRTLGAKGSGPGQLKCPVGVAVDRKGDVIVADCNNDRIVIFHPDGTSSHLITPNNPYSAVIAKNNRLVVSGANFIAEY